MPPVSQSVRFRRLTEELQLADESLKNGAVIDGPILRDLRHALDTLRLTAWTVSEVQNAHENSRDANVVISFLRSERLRRLRQMINALCSDLERDGGSWPSTSVHELQESVRSLRERLSLASFRRRG